MNDSSEEEEKPGAHSREDSCYWKELSSFIQKRPFVSPTGICWRLSDPEGFLGAGTFKDNGLSSVMQIMKAKPRPGPRGRPIY